MSWPSPFQAGCAHDCARVMATVSVRAGPQKLRAMTPQVAVSPAAPAGWRHSDDGDCDK